MSHDDLTRRALLRTGVAAGAAALVGPAATGGGVAVPNDDYETTTGDTEPTFEKGTPEEHYVETEYTLPEAKGGAAETPTLFGEIIWPVDPDTGKTVEDVPVILTYSPYNDISSPQSEVASIADDGLADYYAPRGYARAVFDLVGCRNSGGCYDYGGYRERITGKQLVEYLGGEPDAAGSYVDGDSGSAGTRNVGMIGGSYNGTTAIAAAVEDPDHLAAVVPQVAIDRWYDYAFGGGVRYFLNNEYPTDEGFDTPLAFDLGFGFVPGLNADDGERFVGANKRRFAPCDGVEHTERAYEYDPVYDAFWDRRDYRQRATGYVPEPGTDAAAEADDGETVRGVNCAVFLESGWLDHNVKHWDSTRFFDALPDDAPKKLVMGQWPHTDSNFEDARDVRHAWFDRFLKDIETGVTDLPRVDTQVSTGERLQHEEMPPEGTTVTRFELTRSEQTERSLALRGTLPVYADQKPPATEAQMFATDGSDAGHLKFESAPLSGPLRITGSVPFDDTWRAPLLEVIASVSDDSVQFTPVLYERFPDGSTNVITRGFLNARKRDGLETDEPVPTDEPFVAPTQLWDTDYVLGEGSRLGLVVASDNREWCLDDPDGESVTEIILGAPDSGGGTSLHLPVAAAPDALDVPDVTGTREDDASVFTGGQTNRIDISVEAADERVEIRDRLPEGWSVGGFSDDIERVEKPDDGPNYVYFSPAGESVEVTYFAEAPSGATETGQYSFGPVEARAGESNWVAVEGTSDTNAVVGPEQP
ncbi:hypothetical protein BRD14_01980 [Halobacteriales archaeon SW_5_68_122]|nr:MAG: hypothetical protein BRD14_01980 [Halobacteriales archaeon SW_5_68_122]